MTQQQIKTYTDVYNFLYNKLSNFNDSAFDKISYIAEDYSIEFTNFSEVLLSEFYYDKYRFITK